MPVYQTSGQPRTFSSMEEMLEVQEGTRYKTYKDTQGVPTLGTGLNATFVHPEEVEYLSNKRGYRVSNKKLPDEITPEENDWLKENRTNRAMNDAVRVLGEDVWRSMNPARQAATTSLFYNFGAAKLQNALPETLEALRAGDWDALSEKLATNDVWVSQVGDRAIETANMFATGLFPGEEPGSMREEEIEHIDGSVEKVLVPTNMSDEEISQMMASRYDEYAKENAPDQRDQQRIGEAMSFAERKEVERIAKERMMGALYDQMDTHNPGVLAAQAIGETALMMGSGAVAEVVGGLAGLVGLAGGLMFSDNASDVAVAWQEGFSKALTYSPRSASAQVMGIALGEKLAGVDNAITDWSEKAGQGNVMASTIAKTVAYGALDIAGLKGAVKAGNFGRADRYLRQVEKDAKALGLNLEPKRLERSIIAKADAELKHPDGTPRTAGEATEAVADALHVAKAEAAEVKQAKWARLREENVKDFIDVDAGERFARRMKRELLAEGYDLEDPKVARIMKDFEDIRQRKPGWDEDRPQWESVLDVDINDYILLRKRIGRKISPEANTETDKTLITIKQKMDEWIEDEFDHIARRNNPETLRAWKDARKITKEYRELYNANRTLKKMADANASAGEYKRWIFGANALGAKKEAVSMIRTIKKALGENSPEVKDLVYEAKIDILSPLLEDTPSWGKFIDNWRKLKRQNPELIDELSLDPKEMDLLERYAAHAEKIPPQQSGPWLQKFLIRFSMSHWVGSGLAKKAVRVRAGTDALNKLLGAEHLSRKQLVRRMAQALYEADNPNMPPDRYMVGRNLPLFKKDGPVWTNLLIKAALPNKLLTDADEKDR